MNITEAHNTARQLLDQHGLQGWQVRLDNARQRCGSCHFQRREITLSKHFIGLNDVTEVRNTILHEIAHALAGPGTAHGLHWQQAATRVGAPVRATNATATMPEPLWRLQCLCCERTVAKRHRRSLDLDRARCSYCGIVEGRLRWIRQRP